MVPDGRNDLTWQFRVLGVISALNSINAELAPPPLLRVGVVVLAQPKPGKVIKMRGIGGGHLALPASLSSSCMYLLTLSPVFKSPITQPLGKTLLPLHPMGLQGAYVRPPLAHLARCPTLSCLLSYIKVKQKMS